MDPLVMVGCPVRNRGWILPDYLDRLYKLDYPKDRLIPCFILNDSTDNSEEILNQWVNDHKHEYPLVHYSKMDLGQIEDKRIHSVRIKIYSTLSMIRNRLLTTALLTGCDYLYSVDSDILMPSDSLRKLLSSNKDIIAGQIWNDPTRTFPNIMLNEKGVIKHYLKFPCNQVFKCDVTGAIYLISKKVIEAGVRYGYHGQGEDIPFCLEAKSKGFEIWVDSSVQGEHIMSMEHYKK